MGVPEHSLLHQFHFLTPIPRHLLKYTLPNSPAASQLQNHSARDECDSPSLGNVLSICSFPSYKSKPKDTRASVNNSFFFSPSDLTTVTFFSSGEPVITRLVEQRSEDGKHKMLTCEADAVPIPTFQWSVNITDVSVAAAASAHSCHGAIWLWKEGGPQWGFALPPSVSLPLFAARPELQHRLLSCWETSLGCCCNKGRHFGRSCLQW